jgi:ABC-type phosphate/phosphonate transport system ATPase subunit
MMLKVENLHKFFGANEVLKGVSLEVDKGDVVVILGPSGSGKTTLLRSINFLETAEEGRLQFDDLHIHFPEAEQKQIRDVRLRTGFVFQNYNLFLNKTALENVTEGFDHRQETVPGGGGKNWPGCFTESRSQRPDGILSPAAQRRPAAAGRHRPGHSHQPGSDFF